MAPFVRSTTHHTADSTRCPQLRNSQLRLTRAASYTMRSPVCATRTVACMQGTRLDDGFQLHHDSIIIIYAWILLVRYKKLRVINPSAKCAVSWKAATRGGREVPERAAPWLNVTIYTRQKATAEAPLWCPPAWLPSASYNVSKGT